MRVGGGLSARIALAAWVLLALGGVTGWAAERYVLAEEFTSTWCTYCPDAGEMLGMMMDENYAPPPPRLVLVQYYVSGPHSTPFGNSRQQFYYANLLPEVWFDGTIGFEGWTGGGPDYQGTFEDERQIPADMTISAGAEPTVGSSYLVTIRLHLETSTPERMVRLYLAQTEDQWPDAEVFDRNVCRQGALIATLWMTPGQIAEIQYELDLGGSVLENTRIAVWAQEDLPNKPAVVYQALLIGYPYEPIIAVGDMNCDGPVNFDDIDGFVAALVGEENYYINVPQCDFTAADCDGDGFVSFDDIDAFVELLVGMPGYW